MLVIVARHISIVERIITGDINMTDEKYICYKIIISPFSKVDAIQIKNYLSAFCKDKMVLIEGIETEQL